MRSATEQSIQKANKQLLAAIRKLPQQPLVVGSVLAGFAFFGSFFLLSSQAAAPGNKASYFALEIPGQSKPFVVVLENQEKIEAARNFSKNARTVTGVIVKEKVDYNANWSYHLDPGTIEFIDKPGAACDVTSAYIEENLSQVGNGILAESRWCPSDVNTLREITR